LFSFTRESNFAHSEYQLQAQNIDQAQFEMISETPKYNNFLASYFLQESSFERKNMERSEKGSFLSNLKDFRNIIISKVWATL
jgi:hypothetical protein